MWPNQVGKAGFTLGVRAPKKSIFGLEIGPKLLINAKNIDVRILINAGTLAPRVVANWPSKFDGILFSGLGPIQAHKTQHLFILEDRLKSF